MVISRFKFYFLFFGLGRYEYQKIWLDNRMVLILVTIDAGEKGRRRSKYEAQMHKFWLWNSNPLNIQGAQDVG
ncbi:hypothetical protein L2E82_15695 [Cichorium intybus]|uniref:Uncharacterized protein n=1 Tax=Cichorium intybus TaxID=13427 RepID=A0ACB9F2Z3_CICIN|nr:hypothetical protein L2E82_15695 [Cichorium intybus]